MVFLPQEVITRKRDGHILDDAELAAFIAGHQTGDVTDAQMAAFAMAVYFRDMDKSERVALTLALRDSGETLDWSWLDGPVADKHSTGGVGDNVSLMLAPILAACGAYVPMISGRGLGHTGGTLDKFDAISGYNTQPDLQTFRNVVRDVGCAIIGQTTNLAPADGALYAIRDVTGSVPSVPLITASILSKKMAAGLGSLVLDVKCGSGAFMQSLPQAKELAQSLCDVANGAGLPTRAVITDMDQPLASAAGNALEMRNAIDYLTGSKRDPRLDVVVKGLCTEALLQAGLARDTADANSQIDKVLATGHAAERFDKMVAALGAPTEFVSYHDTYLPKAPFIRDIRARQDGFVSYRDTQAVGMAVVALGGGRRKAGDRIDYAVGFDQLIEAGTKVEAGGILARVHAENEDDANDAEARFLNAIEFQEVANTSDVILAKL